MTQGKDLVPIGSKELATINDDDPTPMWSGAIKAILSEVHQLAQDHDVAPDDRRAGQQHLARKLRDLCGRMESGRWMDGRETLPEPAEEETVLPPHPIQQLTDDDFAARWDDLTRDQKRSLLEEITQNEPA